MENETCIQPLGIQKNNGTFLFEWHQKYKKQKSIAIYMKKMVKKTCENPTENFTRKL
jgi:hypothetical protein